MVIICGVRIGTPTLSSTIQSQFYLHRKGALVPRCVSTCIITANQETCFFIITKLLCGATFKFKILFQSFRSARRCESSLRIKPFCTLEQCISFPNKFIVPSVSNLTQNVNKKGVTFSVYSTRQIIVPIAVAE